MSVGTFQTYYDLSVTLFDTDACPYLFCKSFIPMELGGCVLPKRIMSLLSASGSPVKVIGKIVLGAQQNDLHEFLYSTGLRIASPCWKFL